MRTLYLILLFVGGSWVGLAGQTLSGEVRHGSEPLEGINIVLQDTQQGAFTDRTGKFQLRLPGASGRDTLIVSGIGYEDRLVPVAWTDGGLAGLRIELREANISLAEVTVTGYRPSSTVNEMRTSTFSGLPVEQKYQTQTLHVLNLEAIQELRLQGLEDAVQLAPGFTLEETRGGTFVNINVRGQEATQLYNGLRLEPNTRSGQGNLNFNLLENIEFLNGSSGIAYGNASPGGAVNVNTKQARLSNEGGALLSYGSFNTVMAAVDKNVRLGNKVGLRLNAAFTDGRRARILTDFRNLGLAPSLLWQPSTKDQIRIDYNYSYDERTPDKGNLVRNPNGLEPNDLVDMSFTDDFVGFDEDYQREHTHFAMISYRRTLSPVWTFEVKAGMYDRQRDARKLNSVRATLLDEDTGLYSSFIRASVTQLDRNRSISARADLTAREWQTGFLKHNLQLTVDYWNNYNSISGYDAPDRRNRFSTRDPGPAVDTIDYDDPRLINDVDALSAQQQADYRFRNINASDEDYKGILGFVFQDQVVLWEKLRATLGLRYSLGQNYGIQISDFDTDRPAETRGETNTFNGLSYNAGLFYDLSPAVTLFATYANTFDETSVSASRVDINGNMLPNAVYDQYEAGLRTTFFDRRLSANLTFFRIVNNDQAIRALDDDGNELFSPAAVSPNNPDGFYYVGANYERSQGAELFVQGQISPGWSVLASYAFFEYKLQPNQIAEFGVITLPGSPKHSGNVWTKYEFRKGALKGLSLGAGFQVIGDRMLSRTDVPVTVPSYTRWDALVAYQLRKVVFSAKVNNIFNAESFDAFRTLIVNPIQPTVFDLRINYHF